MIVYPSLEDHAVAIKALLTTAKAFPYDLDELPAKLPTKYTEVSVYRRPGGSMMLGAFEGPRLIRVWGRFVSTTVTNCRMLEDAFGSVEGTRLTVGAFQSTPLHFFSAQPVEKATEGFWAGEAELTYAI